jgi:hypothetical protein
MATKRLMLEAHFPRGAAYGDVYFGLWYPIVVAVMTARVGGVFLRETKDIDIVSGSGIPAAVVRT